jgi:Tfp pilus assembly protein PilN
MIEINLLPVAGEVRAKTARKRPKLVVANIIPTGFGAVLAILVLLYVFASVRVSSLSRKLSSSSQTLHELTEMDRRAKSIEQGLPVLRKRVAVFEMSLEDRNLWSKLLRAIALSCPDNIKLTEISLTVPRGTVSITDQSRELRIKGSYSTNENQDNSEMNFVYRLQKNEDLASHYPRVLVATTDPLPARTDFAVRCTGQ